MWELFDGFKFAVLLYFAMDLFNGFGASEESKRSIVFILYCVYRCVAKNIAKACGWWPVLEFVLFYYMFFA